MGQEKQACPSCSEPVYPTDDVCMSCGADLKGVQQAAPPPPAPGAAQRAPEGSIPTPPTSPTGIPAPPTPGTAIPTPGEPDPKGVPLPRYREPLEKLWYQKIVESCGRLWDIYAWAGIVIWACGGLAWHSGSGIIVLIVLGVSLLWHAVFLFWLIVDVLYFGSEWYWVPISYLCCYPLGFIVYVVWVR